MLGSVCTLAPPAAAEGSQCLVVTLVTAVLDVAASLDNTDALACKNTRLTTSWRSKALKRCKTPSLGLRGNTSLP
jgi:hypothetical protein